MTALSFTNPTVHELRRLLGRRSARRAAGRFVVEGPVLAAEAVAAGWRCIEQFVPAGSGAALDGAGPVHELATGVLERVGSTRTPQPPLVVVAMPPAAAIALDALAFVVVLDRIADPGNCGTILRAAEAAGVEAVALTPGTVDPYNPKAVRASAGALFHVPIVEATPEELALAGIDLVGATSHQVPGRTVSSYVETDFSGRLGLVLGNEASGLPVDWTDQHGPIHRWVTIPHRGRSESLNVAMAATVLVFEAARQRAGDPRSR